MISARRRWAVASLLVGLGWLVSPQPVPIYDGIGQPDEPYRHVSRPVEAAVTLEPTAATVRIPMRDGASTAGTTLSSAEVGPQVSVFLPLGGLSAAGASVVLSATPVAPTDQPSGAVIDGNVYQVRLVNAAGPVTFTPKAALAVIYLRSTTAQQPGPTMYHRTGSGAAWVPLKTARGGSDFYVSSFASAGDYALAFLPVAVDDGGGFPVLPLVLIGVVVLLGSVVLVIRLRASSVSQLRGSSA